MIFTIEIDDEKIEARLKAVIEAEVEAGIKSHASWGSMQRDIKDLVKAGFALEQERVVAEALSNYPKIKEEAESALRGIAVRRAKAALLAFENQANDREAGVQDNAS